MTNCETSLRLAKEWKAAAGLKGKAKVKRWMRKPELWKNAFGRDWRGCGCDSCAEHLADSRATDAASDAIAAEKTEAEKQAERNARWAAACASVADDPAAKAKAGTGRMMEAQSAEEATRRCIAFGKTEAEARGMLDSFLRWGDALMTEEEKRENATHAHMMPGHRIGNGAPSLSEIGEHLAATGAASNRGGLNNSGDWEEARCFDHSNFGLAYYQTRDRHGRDCLLSVEAHFGWARGGKERAGAIVARLSWDGTMQHRMRSFAELEEFGIIDAYTFECIIGDAADTVEGHDRAEFFSVYTATNAAASQERHAVKTPNASSVNVGWGGEEVTEQRERDLEAITIYSA